MYGSGSDPAVGNDTAAHGSGTAAQGSLVEPLSRWGMQVMPGASQRRSRLQRRQQAVGALQREAPDRGSLTPAMRKNYLKELLLSDPSHSGLSSVLSSRTLGVSSQQDADADWVLNPMEHAWMLCAPDGSYDTILEFVSEDPCLLGRRDFVSGYSVLHWLAKSGRDETLIKLLRYAESAGIPADVNVRGSGGLTPLHVASMQGQYMVVKLLVGAFGADVEAMDYNGKRAWQYLRGDAPVEMKELLGAWDDEHSCGHAQSNVNNNSAAAAAGATNVAARDEVDGGRADASSFKRTATSSSWRLGSFKSVLSSYLLGNRS